MSHPEPKCHLADTSNLVEKAKTKLDSIIQFMAKDTLSFEQLAIKYSEDESKNNGGVIVNPQTGSSSFVLEGLKYCTKEDEPELIQFIHFAVDNPVSCIP